MTDNSLTHIHFLLDRSGSMQSIKAATQSGFDEFIAQQRDVKGTCKVTLAQFDTEYEEVYADRDVADVPPLDLQPRHMTALLDSLGRLVTTARARIGALPEAERPGSVMIGVMTDGLENASQEWTHPMVKALIEEQTRADWQFLYLGADQDAIEEGSKMGFAREKSMTYDRGHERAAMAAMTDKVTGYRVARAAGVAAAEAEKLTHYTEQERRAARRTDDEFRPRRTR